MKDNDQKAAADITELFELLPDELVYVDGPLQGYARAKATRQLVAFRCFEIIAGRLWHWTLIPVDSTARPVDEHFAQVAGRPTAWISVLEDARTDERVVTVVEMTGTPPSDLGHSRRQQPSSP